MAEILEQSSLDEQARRIGDEALLDIFASDAGLADPYPAYTVLRERAPVHHSGFGGVVFSRYDDCRAILRDNRFGNGRSGEADSPFQAGDPETLAFRQGMLDRRRARPLSMLALDPPDHTRQRGLVSRAFTPRRVEQLRSRIGALVDERLDALADAGTGDAMELLAEPLPVSVISELLGVPASDWPSIRTQVSHLVLALEPAAGIGDLRRAEAAEAELWAYFTDLVAVRRRQPRDDLISGLIEATDGDDALAEGEIMAVANLLFAAGAETTTNLIGNGLDALLAHPDQLGRLWADPSLVPTAVEEILRFDSPVQLDGRRCLEPAEAYGVRFEPGDRLIALLGSANRDRARFDRPDELDIGRRGEPVLSFASGIHYCLGAHLARAEAQAVLAGLVRRFAAMEPAGPRPRRRRLVIRGLERCPVTVRPR